MIQSHIHHRHHRHHRDRARRRFARSEDGDHGGQGRRHGRGEHLGHGGGRGRGGLGRLFAHGDLKLVALSLIADKPRHGYELIKAIEDRVSGAYSPSPGVIYPTLTLLEELGYVAVAPAPEGGTKKLYEITEEGRSFLAANRKSLDVLLARMDEAGRVHGAGTSPQVVRAMENLKLALRLRLSRGPLDENQVNAIAAALDAAATAVERV